MQMIWILISMQLLQATIRPLSRTFFNLLVFSSRAYEMIICSFTRIVHFFRVFVLRTDERGKNERTRRKKGDLRW